MLEKAAMAVVDRLPPRPSQLGLLTRRQGGKRPSMLQMIQQQADYLRELPFEGIRKW
jgi:hypothetical protein